MKCHNCGEDDPITKPNACWNCGHNVVPEAELSAGAEFGSSAWVADRKRHYETLEARRKALNNTIHELTKMSDEREMEAVRISVEIKAAMAATDQAHT